MKENWKSKARHLGLAYTVGIILTVLYLIVHRYLKTRILEDPNGIEENMDMLTLLYIVAITICNIWYCVSLSKFANLQTNEENRRSLKSVLGGHILLFVDIIAFIIAMMFASDSIPLPALLLIIPPFFAYRKMEKGYRRLQQSDEYNENCQNGFKKLRQSAAIKKTVVLVLIVLAPAALFIIAILGMIVLSSAMNVIASPSSSSFTSFVNTLRTTDNIALIIEVAGIVLLLIIGIVTSWKLLSGWSLVKNNPPEETTTL